MTTANPSLPENRIYFDPTHETAVNDYYKVLQESNANLDSMITYLRTTNTSLTAGGAGQPGAVTEALINTVKKLRDENVDPDIDLSYVGHTTNFVQREKNHKYTCENKNGHGSNCNCQVYNVIRSNGGWDNFKMVFVEKWPCKNRREAEAREQHWIETLKPNMNK